MNWKTKQVKWNKGYMNWKTKQVKWNGIHELEYQTGEMEQGIREL